MHKMSDMSYVLYIGIPEEYYFEPFNLVEVEEQDELETERKY